MSVPNDGPKLPNKTMPRLAALVIRSKPSTVRPRLSTESEQRLEGIEAEKAACYASMEEATYQFQDLANQLRYARTTKERMDAGVALANVTANDSEGGVVEIQITDNGEE